MTTDLLRQYALSFVGVPYLWGGKNPLSGFDCSGLVSEVLKAARMIGPHETMTSQELFDRFSKNSSWNVLKAGSLVFYGEDAKNISHVAMLVDQESAIEAAGGDSTTTSVQAASEQSAFVKIRHLKYRGDLVAVLRPQYLWEQAP